MGVHSALTRMLERLNAARWNAASSSSSLAAVCSSNMKVVSLMSLNDCMGCRLYFEVTLVEEQHKGNVSGCLDNLV